MKRNLAFILLVFMQFSLVPVSEAQQAPFSRGVNLTSWFQARSIREVRFSKYTQKDFIRIKQLGADVIRLPINLHYMTDGAPEYRIDPLFFERLDQVVSWADELGLYLILDNHTFHPTRSTDPGIGDILEKVWVQMAGHYSQASRFLVYEILNEPHGIADDVWNNIQENIISVIRRYDTRHPIMVGPSGYNSYNNLAAMPRYEDNNLIYTFHFYDPFLFTHQGATWTDPSMGELTGVPFPYDAQHMPDLPSSLHSTWVGDNYRSYPANGNVQQVKSLIDIAEKFRDERKVPLFCGEFGVLMTYSRDSDRAFWYEEVRKYLEEKQIAWTTWDYHGGFGLFRKGTSGRFDRHLNTRLITALGFNIPDGYVQ